MPIAGLLIGGVAFGQRLWIAALVALSFAALARILRGVSLSGAISGTLICFILYAAAGPGAFAALASVFVLTWIATRVGYRRKRKLGTAENREGRTASQVLANLAAATAFAAASALTGRVVLLAATAAALAEAAADTVSSELGQIYSQEVRLITTWEAVPAGTNGGISVIGTAAGILAAITVTCVCAFVKLVPRKWGIVPLVAGAFGMFVDSYLGAVLERRNLLNNNWVNFLGTLTAAAIALLLAKLAP
jgi:uncharacterized protein (TIGR00297 family)